MHWKSALTLAAVLIALSGAGYVRWESAVMEGLKAREHTIKDEIMSELSGAATSNAPDGVAQFVGRGELVFRREFLCSPSQVETADRFPIRMSPRVSTGPSDGWVGRIDEGTWYVKVY